ncbi:MAG: hypothetical protein ABFD10_20435 [Prolixibacteraceae bacterium]
MNRKILIPIIIILLFSFDVFLGLRTVMQNAKINDLRQIVKENKKQQKELIKSFIYQKQVESSYEGTLIEGRLLDTINFDGSLILRLNTKGCQKCIEDIFLSMNKFKGKLICKVIIIGTFETKTEFKYYTKKVLKDWHVINLEKEYLMDNQLEYDATLFFFTIDESKKIRDLFVPNKNFPVLTDAYLNMFCRTYEN